MVDRKEVIEKIKKEAYLGDGAYVHHDGHHVVLTTNDGIRETNRVCLEPACLRAFEEYLERLKDLIGILKTLD